MSTASNVSCSYYYLSGISVVYIITFIGRKVIYTINYLYYLHVYASRFTATLIVYNEYKYKLTEQISFKVFEVAHPHGGI